MSDHLDSVDANFRGAAENPKGGRISSSWGSAAAYEDTNPKPPKANFLEPL